MVIRTNNGYGALIQNAAQKYGVDPELIQSVIGVESGGNPSAASGTGPVGLMQVSRALAKDYGYSPEDRLDPAKNIDMGVRYLAQNLKAFGGDATKALLGYNQGTNGARQMLNGKIPVAPEGAKYITNPAFQKFTKGGIDPNITQTANPVATLAQGKSDDQFNPALLNRGVAQAAPDQQQAMSQAAMPIAPAYQPQDEESQAQQQDDYDPWGKAALGAISLLGYQNPKSKTVQSGIGMGRGASNWSPETQRVMQLLQQVTSAPNFSGGA